MSPAMIWGDFDGDGARDWAAQIVAERDGGERHAFVFLDRGDSTEPLLLFRGGSDFDALYLVPAGEDVYDSTAAGWWRVPRDAIGVMRGDSAFVYEIEADVEP